MKMRRFTYCITIQLLVSLASAALITYDWSIGWITANPDGRLPRPAIAINGQWPSPTIQGNVGDTVSVTIHNNLGNESLSIHWHGLFQKGNIVNDGVPMITQCPIIPRASYTYTFNLDQPGTYWYHSHSASQYVDGLRGPLIIHDPNNPYRNQFSQEMVLTLSDWYHNQSANIEPEYLSVALNPWNGSEPVPDSALMNDIQSPKFSVWPNTTYYLRIINVSGFAQFYLHIDGHNFTIIEVDGVYTEPQSVQDLYLNTGQRYGVLLETKPAIVQNYAILGSMDMSAFDSGALPADLNQNVSGTLVYNAWDPIPTQPVVSMFNTFDDFDLVPYDKMPLLSGNPDTQIVFNLNSLNQSAPNNDQYRFGLNNITFIAQKVPSLYTTLSARSDATNPIVYGTNADAYVLEENNLIEIVINNLDTGPHPLHIHGRNVQVVARELGTYNGTGSMPAIPMRRDTWNVQPSGYVVIRYIANNPGVWFFHCHMEWHLDGGLAFVLVENPTAVQDYQSNIPQSMKKICAAQSIPLMGNAAGNTKNYTDLMGEITVGPLECGALYPPDKCGHASNVYKSQSGAYDQENVSLQNPTNFDEPQLLDDPVMSMIWSWLTSLVNRLTIKTKSSPNQPKSL